MSLLLTLASVFCAGLPMLGFLALIWWLDRYDREPVWLLSVVFLWGAIGAVWLAAPVSMVASGLTEAWLQHAGVQGWWLHARDPVIVAPITEEPAKAVVLMWVLFNRHFDNMTDGFVYGAAAGLGFGMTENLVYFVDLTADAQVWGQTVVLRTFYSAVMHATATAILGASLGHARFKGLGPLVRWGVAGLTAACVVHGLWNALALAPGGQDQLFVVDLVLLPLEVALVFAVFQVCLIDESRTIQLELEEEAAAGLIPAHHPKILASWLRRISTRWVPPGIDHDHYVRLATDLAMRKHQVRQMGDRAPAFYREEVTRLRQAVRVELI